MKLRFNYLVLIFSLGIALFSPPSNAVKTLAQILASGDATELDTYIQTLEAQHIPQIRTALSLIFVPADDSSFLGRVKRVLSERLAQLIQPSSGLTLSSPLNPVASLTSAVAEVLGTGPSAPIVPRVTTSSEIGRMISFSPVRFLNDARKKLSPGDLKTKIDALLANSKRDQNQMVSLCWKALAKLKNQILISGNLDHLPFVYMTMAKLLLATQIPPDFELSAGSPILAPTPKETYNRVNTYLRGRFKQFNIDKNHEDKPNKIYKWSILYYALLNIDYVSQNPGAQDNVRMLVDAYNFLRKAKELRMTKSVHAFLAHFYLEYAARLGFDQEEIGSFVSTELELFHASKPAESTESTLEKEERGATSFWNVVAQPPYFRDRIVQDDVRLLFAQLASRGQEPPQAPDAPITIPQLAPDASASLPALQVDARYLIERGANYVFQGRAFTNYNVSGHDFRCFFNSLGLNALAQIELLKQHRDDLRVRAMIANEIVSAWRSYYELPDPVRVLLNARDLFERQARVDRLARTESQQDLRQQLQREQDAILTELRQRASRLDVFQSFVTHQIGTRIDGDEVAPYPMMVMQRDVRADNADILPNLSTIDAIALVNRIGLRVFQVDGTELRLIHNYIPEEATAVAHVVYFRGAEHFTALLPAANPSTIPDLEESNDEEDSFGALDAQIQAAFGESTKHNSMGENLLNLLRARFPTVKNSSMQTDDSVRLLLFLSAQGWTHEEIAEHPFVNLSRSRIGAVLVENGVQRKWMFDDKTTDRIFDAYLSSGYGLKGQGRGFSEIAGPIAEHLGLNQEEVKKFLEYKADAKARYFQSKGLSQAQRAQIVSLYTENPSFSFVVEQTGVPHLCILMVLTEDLSHDLRPQIIDPSHIKTKEPIEVRNKKIVDVFHNLSEAGQTPTASDVSRQSGYSLKITLKVLKEAGVMESTTKSKHLSKETIEQIKATWIARGWNVAPERTKHYAELAAEFGAGFIQVREMLKEVDRESRMEARDERDRKIIAAFHHLSRGGRVPSARAVSLHCGIEHGTVWKLLKAADLIESRTSKTKHQTSAADIQEAYTHLPPEEQPNALALLSELFSCDESQIADALGALGVHLVPHGAKRPRKE